jgi:hypothetical protein
MRIPNVRTWMLSSILAVVCLASVAGADQVERAKRGDNEARAILERSAEFISAAERFEVEAEVSYDVNRAMGSLIESGSTRRITVVRPDRVRVEVARRDGSHLQLVSDGKEMTVHRSRDDVYAKQAIKGGLDSVVDTIIAQIGVRPPLMDLLYSNLWAVLRPRIVAGESHGKSIIGGVECTHLSFQDFDLDWEIWIENGERPLPRRIVVRYDNRPGDPTVRISLGSWNLSPKTPDSLFALKVPKTARKVKLSDFSPEEMRRDR